LSPAGECNIVDRALGGAKSPIELMINLVGGRPDLAVACLAIVCYENSISLDAPGERGGRRRTRECRLI
jgi:hypothetical protein